ncbi:MAG: YesL family protein [Lachnospiraceae bacterium]
MRNFFDLDNPFIQFLNRLTDVVILNVICLICCIPVVTAGASITALHYVTMKMARNEEGYMLRDFFKSFRQNFRQSTIIWGIFLLITLFFYVDIRIFNTGAANFPKILKLIIYMLYFFVCLTAMYAFPLLSRFSNTVMNTIKNGFLMSIIHVFKTLLMAAVYLLPILILPLHGTLMGVYLLIGIAGPAYVNSFIWKGIFKRYEPTEELQEEGDGQEEGRQ